ncbi:MAG: hypothetical protein AAB214_17080 [Fibrobacterota bacterium]
MPSVQWKNGVTPTLEDLLARNCFSIFDQSRQRSTISCVVQSWLSVTITLRPKKASDRATW